MRKEVKIARRKIFKEFRELKIEKAKARDKSEFSPFEIMLFVISHAECRLTKSDTKDICIFLALDKYVPSGVVHLSILYRNIWDDLLRKNIIEYDISEKKVSIIGKIRNENMVRKS